MMECPKMFDVVAVIAADKRRKNVSKKKNISNFGGSKNNFSRHHFGG